ncbi:MAG: site-specific integrase, partial [Candidatus Nealsonbacteria bacterium]|nr:site-specific integrase [Candidatus Nealsonbacteria bacterium]
WLSGLRLEESLAFSWDADAPISVDLSGRFPRLRIDAAAEKGRRDRLLPLTPDFAEWLLETPAAERRGRVFRLGNLRTGSALDSQQVSLIVSAIGKRAGIVVKRTKGKGRADKVKHASCHDLRRSFATRWAPKVKPATLQLLMRHSSIETTLGYYVELDADELAEELWNDYSGNTCGNSGQNSPMTSLEV